MVASWLGCLTVLMLFTLAAPDASSAEPPPRAPLDALWQEHMLKGNAATIYVDESGQRTLLTPRRPFDEQHGEEDVEDAAITTYGYTSRDLMSAGYSGETGVGSCGEDSSLE